MSLIQGILEEEYRKYARQLTDFLRGPLSKKQQRAVAVLRDDMAFIEKAFIANQLVLADTVRCDSQTEIMYAYPAIFGEAADGLSFFIPDLPECRGVAPDRATAEHLAAQAMQEAISALLREQQMLPEPSDLDLVRKQLPATERARLVTAGKPYTVILQTTITGVDVSLPELPGCTARGVAEADALAALAVAKAEWLDHAFRERTPQRRQSQRGTVGPAPATD